MTGGPAVDLPTSTTFELPGYTVERTLGLSWGLIVRSVGLTKGQTGTVRSLKAGEVKEFTEVVDRARHTALERLFDHARQLGGNAVLGVRFDSSDLGNGERDSNRSRSSIGSGSALHAGALLVADGGYCLPSIEPGAGGEPLVEPVRAPARRGAREVAG